MWKLLLFEISAKKGVYDVLFTQKYCVMWKILMFEISAKKGVCNVLWGSEVKTSDLATHFGLARNSGAANTVLFTIPNVQRTFKDGKIKSTVFTKPHVMKRHKIMSPLLKNRDS